MVHLLSRDNIIVYADNADADNDDDNDNDRMVTAIS